MVCKARAKCDKCGREVTTNNFKRHIDKCNGESYIPKIPGKRGGWNKGLTKYTNASLAKAGQTYKAALARGEFVRKTCAHSKEFKNKMANLAHERGLGGHTSKRKMYYQRKDGLVVYLHSSYEIKFAQIADELGINWVRPDPIIWVDEFEKKHRYYPDFKVGEVYIDTKNDYLAIVDLPKINAVREQANVDVRILTKEMLNKEFISTLV